MQYIFLQIPNVENLLWGQTITASVERQNAHFYRLKVTEEDLRTGVIVTCTSSGNDKFKAWPPPN